MRVNGQGQFPPFANCAKEGGTRNRKSKSRRFGIRTGLVSKEFASEVIEPAGESGYRSEQEQVEDEVHGVGRGVRGRGGEDFQCPREEFLIVKRALVSAEEPRQPPALNLKHGPSPVSHESDPHEPTPALPDSQGE